MTTPRQKNPKQFGRASRLTAEQIARVRDCYQRWKEARYERMRITAELGLRPDEFNRYGLGSLGKKPKPEEA